MASGTTPKVRFVRCPNCRLVLPELADVPVYKCGGCETILVAKNRKAISKSTSVLQETEAAQANKSVHVSEHGESSSSTQQEVLPPPPQRHLSQESGGNLNISSDSHTENHDENISIEGQHNDPQLSSSYRESSTSTQQEVLPAPPQCHLSQESGGSQNISSDSPTENYDENLSTEVQHNDHHKKDQNTSSDRDSELDELQVNRSNEGQENVGEQLQLQCSEYCNVQQSGVSSEGSLSAELHHQNEELILLAGANLEAEANEQTSQLEGANCELESNNKSDPNIRVSSIDNSPDTREIDLTATASGAVGEVISSDHLVSSPIEHLEQPQKSEQHRFDRLRSTATFESADFATPSSEFSGPLEYLSKSNTTRSSHAYDGSISSFDGIDYHFPDRQIHSMKNNYKAANYLVPEERHRRDKLPAKGMMSGNSGVRDQARNFSSDLSYKKHYATEKYRRWRQGEVLEPVMHHHPPRNWARQERDEYPSQIPFSQRASLRGYETAGPSRELHDEFPFDPLDKAEYAEQENLKLLRIMYEVQDQISKTCHLNGNPNGRTTSTEGPWRQKQHFPTCYCQEEEHYDQRYQGRHGQRSSWSHQSRFSRIPFSGGAINTRHHIDNSCSCCHPQDWLRSEQLPPPICQHNRGFCTARHGQSCYNSFSSCPSTPQRYLESDYSIWSHETKSDDLRYKDHELKRYLREKQHHSVRKHLRPMAGGAPFVTCYHCFTPLQLPADFLLFKRRFHQLQCGACSKVLKFSLQRGSHIVPYELVVAEPPPSEVEGDAINVRTSPSESCSHGCLQADPVCYSDDYENSFCKSCSTDGDPVCLAKLQELQGNTVQQRKDFVLKQQSQYQHKNSAETFDSAGPSSRLSRSEKLSSELEELPPRAGGSPLHKLMGYSSPSQVINGEEF